MKPISLFISLAGASLLATAASAQDVRITTFKTESTFTLNGRTFTVARNQDTSARLEGDFTLTSRACPPHCIQPMIAAPGVATYGELEVIGFLEARVSTGTGLMLDVRDPSAFGAGTIPGAVNVPHTTLGEENRFRSDILRALGATDGANDAMDFTNAMSLTVFSSGVWSSDATTAINDLLSAGYPANKLSYFRGGMQAWEHVGLTVQ